MWLNNWTLQNQAVIEFFNRSVLDKPFALQKLKEMKWLGYVKQLGPF